MFNRYPRLKMLRDIVMSPFTVEKVQPTIERLNLIEIQKEKFERLMLKESMDDTIKLSSSSQASLLGQFRLHSNFGYWFFPHKNEHQHDFRNPIYTFTGDESQEEKEEIKKAAFKALKENAAPKEWESSLIEGEEDSSLHRLAIVGPVVTLHDEENLSIFNKTIGGHILHDGYVLRSVEEHNNELYIRTTGGGIGPFGRTNDFFSKPLWAGVDSYIPEQMKSHLKKSDKE